VVFEVPRIDGTASPATAASPAAARLPAADARFVDIVHAAAGSIQAGGDDVQVEPRRLSLRLPVTAPSLGDAIEASGFIDLRGEGELELALALVSPYQNPRALGRISLCVEIGDRWRYVEDLAANPVPVQLRLFTTGPRRLPVRLSLHVQRNCFPSQAWPRLSRVELRLGAATPSAHGCELNLVASRGAAVAIHPETGAASLRAGAG